VFNAIDFVNKQVDQSRAKENRNHDITTVQDLLGQSVKVMAAGRQILRQTDAWLTKLRSAPGIIFPLNGLVLLASCVQTPDQVILQLKILNFRFANGYDNISFVHEGREHVVFSTAQNKIAWLDPFVEIRPSALNGIHGEGKITMAKWLDIEVGNGISVVTNRPREASRPYQSRTSSAHPAQADRGRRQGMGTDSRESRR
jgi:hypothetical protein